LGIGGWSYFGNAGTNSGINFIGTTDTAQLVFRTNNTPKMTIFSSGGVGIGTSGLPAGDAVLAVNGTVYSSKTVITLTGWPDYVFGKNYSLPSLAKVGRYIRQYRHLPGILSAGEVAEEGIDLGGNQAQLLKKIEELTLYLIDEHKQSDLRQKEIERLKEQNKSPADYQHEIDQLRETLQKLSVGK
jgi:hypothetical protein